MAEEVKPVTIGQGPTERTGKGSNHFIYLLVWSSIFDQFHSTFPFSYNTYVILAVEKAQHFPPRCFGNL